MPRVRVTSEVSHEFIHVDDPDQFIHLLYMNGRHYDTHIFTQMEMQGFHDLLANSVPWKRFVKAVGNNGLLARLVYDDKRKEWDRDDDPIAGVTHPWTPEGWYRGVKNQHLTLFELVVFTEDTTWEQQPGGKETVKVKDAKAELHVSAYNPTHAGRGLGCPIQDRPVLYAAVRDALYGKSNS